MICGGRPGRNFFPIGWLARAALVASIAMAQPGFASLTIPIDGEFTPERVSAGVGTTVAFRLEVATTVAFARVAVRLKVPDGMSLVAGTADAEIANFMPGAKRVFEYWLRLDQPGEKQVWVEAEVLGIAPSVLRKSFLSEVNPKDDGKSKATIRRDPDGTSYQVQGISIKPPQ
jgi:hypothetical protein